MLSKDPKYFLMGLFGFLFLNFKQKKKSNKINNELDNTTHDYDKIIILQIFLIRLMKNTL